LLRLGSCNRGTGLLNLRTGRPRILEAFRVPALEAEFFKISTGVLCTLSAPTTVLALLPSLPYPAVFPRPSRGYMYT
jgi:hypothetical protein